MQLHQLPLGKNGHLLRFEKLGSASNALSRIAHHYLPTLTWHYFATFIPQVCQMNQVQRIIIMMTTYAHGIHVNGIGRPTGHQIGDLLDTIFHYMPFSDISYGLPDQLNVQKPSSCVMSCEIYIFISYIIIHTLNSARLQGPCNRFWAWPPFL